MVYLLFILVIISRIVTFGRLHGISSDEYFYTLVAREILASITGDPLDLRAIDALHPPLFPYILAWVYRLTGQSGIEAGRMLGVVLSLGAVLFFYKISVLHFKSPRQALWATALFAFIPALWRDADRVWADNLALFLVTAAIYAVYLGFRSGRSRYWLAAWLLLAATVLTKEYLGVVLLPAFLVIIILWTYRSGKWGYGLGLAGALFSILILAVVWQLNMAGWPRAGYLEQMLSPALLAQRRSYLGIGAPDLRKLYVQNLNQRDFPWSYILMAFMLPFTGKLKSLAGSLADRSSARGIYLFHTVLASCLVIYISLMGHQYGSRLIFPALPSLTLMVAAAFFQTGRRSLVIPYALLAIPFSLWSWPIQGRLESLLSLGLAALLVFYILLRSISRNIALRSSLAAVVVLAFMANSFIVLYRDAGRQERLISNYGTLQGMERTALWLRRNAGPEEGLLSFNPRQTACLLNRPYRRFAVLSWWDIEHPLPQISRDYLVRNRIKWVVISRPEACGPLRNGLYRTMRQAGYLEQAYLDTTADGEVIAAVFKLQQGGRSDAALGHHPGL
ncbi:MAG: glycosyltransferase family 39 protein [bacterium]|nr:glycosyltransferase family 39 protein [bacterium]